MSRLSVNVNEETRTDLVTLAHRKGTSATEIIRRAVAVFDYLDKHQQQGDEIRLTDGNETETVVLL